MWLNFFSVTKLTRERKVTCLISSRFKSSPGLWCKQTAQPDHWEEDTLVTCKWTLVQITTEWMQTKELNGKRNKNYVSSMNNEQEKKIPGWSWACFNHRSLENGSWYGEEVIVLFKHGEMETTRNKGTEMKTADSFPFHVFFPPGQCSFWAVVPQHEQLL